MLFGCQCIFFCYQELENYFFSLGIPKNYLITTKIARVKVYSTLLSAYADGRVSLVGYQIFQFITKLELHRSFTTNSTTFIVDLIAFCGRQPFCPSCLTGQIIRQL